MPSFQGVKASIKSQLSCWTDPELLHGLNKSLFLDCPRNESGCEIVPWGESDPSVLYADRCGFIMYDWLLEEWGLSFPFPNWVSDVLNLVNACPVQLGPNAWRHLLAFGQRCAVEGVVPLAALFFYFFHAECQQESYISMTRRRNRLVILTKCPNHPKG